jgi:hypothetical protein
MQFGCILLVELVDQLRQCLCAGPAALGKELPPGARDLHQNDPASTRSRRRSARPSRSSRVTNEVIEGCAISSAARFADEIEYEA